MDYSINSLVRLTGFLVAIITVLIVLLAPSPPPPGVSRPRATEWRLPERHKDYPVKSALIVTARNLWGIIAGSPGSVLSKGPLNPPEWRFAGADINGTEQNVLISIAGNPVQFLKEGDQLPGGATILKIHEDRLCILLNGKKRTLAIFQ